VYEPQEKKKKKEKKKVISGEGFFSDIKGSMLHYISSPMVS
jgi:hypothetical protein